MSIMSYNGGAVMAMKGKNCVVIAADRRFGIQAQMVTTDFQKIFPMGDHLYIGLAGLATDVQTVAQRLKFRLNLYELKEGRQIKPHTLMSMVANLLYEKRFGPYYTEPVIAGLDPKTFKPFICSLDLIGCPMVTDDFVVSGTCTEQMPVAITPVLSMACASPIKDHKRREPINRRKLTWHKKKKIEEKGKKLKQRGGGERDCVS
ncbi:PREDICTED: proteasome subunit beta type-3-like [Chrysochloris asiatica]|uniref:Proteasome subunit beta n=1 Tax=Chrysochloris asiatica TaxID=185453 RepID=A0A9B0TGL6_CHRAS|nr:PREDICTED: proteasome subunit beta type-3-like [Chrysochloris asiatica]